MAKRFQQHKYKAIAVTYDGIRFDSKKEGKYYNELKLRVMSGEVVFFLRQTPFHIEGGTYRVDFQEFHSDGTVHFIDVKGVATTAFKKSKKQVELKYPVEIEIV